MRHRRRRRRRDARRQTRTKASPLSRSLAAARIPFRGQGDDPTDRPTDRPLASSPPACLYRLCALLKIGVHSRIPARRWPDVRRIVYRRAFCRVHSRRACVFTARASVHKRLWKGNRPRRGNTRRIDFQWARWGDFPVLNWEILLGLYGIIFLLISIDRGWFVRIGALRRDWEEIEEESLKFFFPERVICNFF